MVRSAAGRRSAPDSCLTRVGERAYGSGTSRLCLTDSADNRPERASVRQVHRSLPIIAGDGSVCVRARSDQRSSRRLFVVQTDIYFAVFARRKNHFGATLDCRHLVSSRDYRYQNGLARDCWRNQATCNLSVTSLIAI